MKKNRSILYAVGAAVLLALILWARGHVKFDWETFLNQIKHVDGRRIALGVVFIWLGYVLRGLRWAVLLKPQKKVNGFSLIGSQVIGFTAVALFGRLAEVVRIYLITKRTRLTFSSQAAVYTVERMFDLGSMALIFSSALLLAPDRATLPHHEALQHAALFGLVLAAALGVFAFVVRASGGAVARLAEKSLSGMAPGLGQSISSKILAFREGLDAIRSLPTFLSALLISLAMWGLITAAYLETTRAFVLSPPLASMTLGRCMVLMAASMVGSAIQLPIIGWFTQIAVIAGVTQKIFNVSPEAALGCGAMLLIVTFLSVIPLGLIWARFEHVSLKQISEESEHVAAEEAGQPVAVTES